MLYFFPGEWNVKTHFPSAKNTYFTITVAWGVQNTILFMLATHLVPHKSMDNIAVREEMTGLCD